MAKSYIARCKCGNVVCVASGNPEGFYTKKEIAKTVGGWIRNGLEIDRMEAEEFRQLKSFKPGGFGCICKKNEVSDG